MVRQRSLFGKTNQPPDSQICTSKLVKCDFVIVWHKSCSLHRALEIFFGKGGKLLDIQQRGCGHFSVPIGYSLEITLQPPQQQRDDVGVSRDYLSLMKCKPNSIQGTLAPDLYSITGKRLRADQSMFPCTEEPDPVAQVCVSMHDKR